MTMGGRFCVYSGGDCGNGRLTTREGVKEFGALELRQRHPSRAVASRQRSRNSGGRPRLAAEIPDIFLPLARNDVRNDDGFGVVAICAEGICRREGLTTGEGVKESSPPSFQTFGAATAVTENAGGEVDQVARGRSWQPEIGMEHASRGRRSGNKGVGARWRGRFRIFSARHCSRTKVSHAENSGMTMLFFSLEVAPMSEGDSFTGSGVGGTRGFNFLFWGLFHTLGSDATRTNALFGFVGGAVVVCSEGGCGSMCWPVDRPATHAAAGAAARGALIFLFWGGLSHAQEWMRTRGLGVGGLIRCAGRPREWSCGAVPPQERWHEGGWFLFFLWRLLRCRRGILSHAREWSDTHAATE